MAQRIVLAAAALLALIGAAAGQSSSLSAPATQADISAAMVTVPAPSSVTPPATALDGAQGAATTYARADHTHAVRVQRTALTTAADGTATWTFSRPISVPTGKVPPVAYMVEDTGSPVVVQVTGRTMTSDGTTDTHTAVTIRAQRSRVLAATLVSLAALLNFDVFAGRPRA